MEMRQETGAMLLDCAAALRIAKGDGQKALSLLRAQGTIHGFPHSLQTEARLRALEGKKQ
jgi:translation elongation factor EF-Ts